MRRFPVLAGLILALALAATASAGTGSELSGVIKSTEQLRGLDTTHPLVVTTLSAAGLRRMVAREIARERRPRSDAAWNDALHLLGVLRPGQSLAKVQRQALAGQVAGMYVPRNRRLYVLGAGGAAPRSVIAHEVVHALQDEHFRLTRPAFGPRPGDHDGELAAQALVEGDATEVQERYVRSLSPGDLVSELARTLKSVPDGASTAAAPYLQRQLLYPYAAGEQFVRALRARGGQRLLDRAFRHPPRTSAAVLDPDRYLAGDPPAQRVALPAGSYAFTTTFGAEDIVALTGANALARSWLGGRMGIGPRGLDLRVTSRGARALAAALAKALPYRAGVAFRGRLVCVRVLRGRASARGLSCR